MSTNSLCTANLSCESVESAWRRACRSPRLASVISFSISGLTAFALACVVLTRSCSMISFERFISSALRCAESRLSLLRVFWCLTAGSVDESIHPPPPAAGVKSNSLTRTGRGGRPPVGVSMPSVLAEVQPSCVQGFDDLVDRLFAEVGDRVQLRLGLRDQVA